VKILAYQTPPCQPKTHFERGYQKLVWYNTDVFHTARDGLALETFLPGNDEEALKAYGLVQRITCKVIVLYDSPRKGWHERTSSGRY